MEAYHMKYAIDLTSFLFVIVLNDLTYILYFVSLGTHIFGDIIF